MKLVEQDYELWGKAPLSFKEGLPWIERAGRTCYKSDCSNITYASAKKFMNTLLSNEHMSVLEHSNLVFRYKIRQGSQLWGTVFSKLRGYFNSKWIHVVSDERDYIYIFGNWRAFFEFTKGKNPHATMEMVVDTITHFHFIDGLELVKNYSSIPGFAHRYTVKFKTDRAVLAALTRHRDDVAFSVESQRYDHCANKKVIECVKPWFFDKSAKDVQKNITETLKYAITQYKKAIKIHDMTAQEARYCLPNAVAVDVVMTAYLPEWMLIFGLRRGKQAYPQMDRLLDPLFNDMVVNGQFKGV